MHNLFDFFSASLEERGKKIALKYISSVNKDDSMLKINFFGNFH